MASIFFAIIGAAVVYAGILMLHQDYLTGMAGIIVGIVLLSKPLLQGIGYLRPMSSAGAGVGRKKGPRAKTHLKLVKSGDEKRPTIH